MYKLSQKIVIARKPHICSGCGRTFPAGTQLLCEHIADAGTVFNNYLCATCETVLNKYDIDEYCEGDLRDYAIEYENEILNKQMILGKHQ